MANQQSSFSGMRMALTFQLRMACSDASSEGPSKIPLPWMQLYSVPERLTPRSCTSLPSGSTSLLPEADSTGSTAPPLPEPPSDFVPASGFDAEPEVPPSGATLDWSPPSPTVPLHPGTSQTKSSAPQMLSAREST